ncbi:hypothetical protein DIE19_33600 [Burkholderia sp. Bp9126]|nr:hypothetical protein DIE19_33600 [Burkholderia sp. Bp9126]
MVRLTDLEETLYYDNSGQARDRMIAMLADMAATRGDGAPAMQHVFSAARDIIDILWHRYHDDHGSGA